MSEKGQVLFTMFANGVRVAEGQIVGLCAGRRSTVGSRRKTLQRELAQVVWPMLI